MVTGASPKGRTEVEGWQHKLSRVSQNRAAVSQVSWATPRGTLLATGLPRHPLPEPDARALSVLIDEQDTCGFESTSNDIDVERRGSPAPASN
jgi:hypothetical protein